MTPAQMKKVIMLAKSKAATIAERTSPEEETPQDQEAEVVGLAKKMAQDRWGAGPIQGGGAESEAEKAYRDLWERSKRGDTKATVELILND
jgi:hypothetical protein